MPRGASSEASLMFGLKLCAGPYAVFFLFFDFFCFVAENGHPDSSLAGIVAEQRLKMALKRNPFTASILSHHVEPRCFCDYCIGDCWKSF